MIIPHLSARFLISIFSVTKNLRISLLKIRIMRKNREKKVVVTGDLMLNGINEKGLSKSHNLKSKIILVLQVRTSLIRWTIY